MANYAKDDDMVKLRADILQLGVNDWLDQHKEAKAEIDRHLEINWYRGNADDLGIDWRESANGFDPALLSDVTQLNKAATFLALSLAYEFLTRNAEDGFSTQRDYYRGKYNEEIDAVLLHGIDYDWPDVSDTDVEVALQRHARTLVRG